LDRFFGVLSRRGKSSRLPHSDNDCSYKIRSRHVTRAIRHS
jgi:hypothetical protein